MGEIEQVARLAYRTFGGAESALIKEPFCAILMVSQIALAKLKVLFVLILDPFVIASSLFECLFGFGRMHVGNDASCCNKKPAKARDHAER